MIQGLEARGPCSCSCLLLLLLADCSGTRFSENPGFVFEAVQCKNGGHFSCTRKENSGLEILKPLSFLKPNETVNSYSLAPNPQP